MAPVLNRSEISAYALGEFNGELPLNTKLDISLDETG